MCVLQDTQATTSLVGSGGVSSGARKSEGGRGGRTETGGQRIHRKRDRDTKKSEKEGETPGSKLRGMLRAPAEEEEE